MGSCPSKAVCRAETAKQSRRPILKSDQPISRFPSDKPDLFRFRERRWFCLFRQSRRDAPPCQCLAPSPKPHKRRSPPNHAPTFPKRFRRKSSSGANRRPRRTARRNTPANRREHTKLSADRQFHATDTDNCRHRESKHRRRDFSRYLVPLRLYRGIPSLKYFRLIRNADAKIRVHCVGREKRFPPNRIFPKVWSRRAVRLAESYLKKSILS